MKPSRLWVPELKGISSDHQASTLPSHGPTLLLCQNPLCGLGQTVCSWGWRKWNNLLDFGRVWSRRKYPHVNHFLCLPFYSAIAAVTSCLEVRTDRSLAHTHRYFWLSVWGLLWVSTFGNDILEFWNVDGVYTPQSKPWLDKRWWEQMDRYFLFQPLVDHWEVYSVGSSRVWAGWTPTSSTQEARPIQEFSVLSVTLLGLPFHFLEITFRYKVPSCESLL